MVMGRVYVDNPRSVLEGRAADLETVAALLKESTERVIGIFGPGGIGKTRLTMELVGSRVEELLTKPLERQPDPETRSTERLFRYCTWKSSRSSRPGDPGESYDALTTESLLTHLNNMLCPGERSRGHVQALLDVRDQLSQTEVLIVVDNMETAENPKDLVEWLDSKLLAGTLGKAIVMSRTIINTASCFPFELSALSKASASALLQRLLNDHGAAPLEKPQLEAVLRQTPCWPLAIELVAGLLRDESTRAMVIDRLSVDLARPGDILTDDSVRAFYDVLFRGHAQQIELGKEILLFLIDVSPRGATIDQIVDVLTKVSGGNRESEEVRLGDLLLALKDRFLVQERADERRYVLHAFVESYMRRQLAGALPGEGPRTHRPERGGWLDMYEKIQDRAADKWSSYAGEPGRWDQEWHNIEKALSCLGASRRTDVALALENFMLERGHWKVMEQSMATGRRYCQDVKDRLRLARIDSALARLYFRRSRLDEAAGVLTEAERECERRSEELRELGSNDLSRDLAETRRVLSTVWYLQGAVMRAQKKDDFGVSLCVKSVEEKEIIERKTDINDKDGLASALFNLGAGLTEQANALPKDSEDRKKLLERAFKALERSIELFVEIKDDDHTKRTRIRLARLHVEMRRAAEAHRELDKVDVDKVLSPRTWVDRALVRCRAFQLEGRRAELESLRSEACELALKYNMKSQFDELSGVDRQTSPYR